MLLYVKVKPGAKQEKIERSGDNITISVRARPVENKANIAVVEALSRYLNKPKSRITVIRGEKSKNKTIEVD